MSHINFLIPSCSIWIWVIKLFEFFFSQKFNQIHIIEIQLCLTQISQAKNSWVQNLSPNQKILKCSPSTLSATQTFNHVGLGRQQKKHLITQTTIHTLFFFLKWRYIHLSLHPILFFPSFKFSLSFKLFNS